jgi:hypothetical protein
MRRIFSTFIVIAPIKVVSGQQSASRKFPETSTGKSAGLSLAAGCQAAACDGPHGLVAAFQVAIGIGVRDNLPVESSELIGIEIFGLDDISPPALLVIHFDQHALFPCGAGFCDCIR